MQSDARQLASHQGRDERMRTSCACVITWRVLRHSGRTVTRISAITAVTTTSAVDAGSSTVVTACHADCTAFVNESTLDATGHLSSGTGEARHVAGPDNLMSMPDSRATAVRAGIADSWAVGLGLIPLGLAFGVVLTQGGFDWWWAPIFSIVIYAGSMEFLAIGLISAVTPFASIAAATLLVNFRHVFYGLSFPLRSIRSRIGRLYAVYALTDESYAIVAPKAGQDMSGTRVLTVQVLCQAMWVVSGVVGALIGAVLPAGLTGLEFALTALFTVLAIDAFRVNRDVPATVIAVVCGLVAMLIAKEQMLVVGLGLFVACLLARFVYRNRTASA